MISSQGMSRYDPTSIFYRDDMNGLYFSFHERDRGQF